MLGVSVLALVPQPGPFVSSISTIAVDQCGTVGSVAGSFGWSIPIAQRCIAWSGFLDSVNCQEHCSEAMLAPKVQFGFDCIAPSTRQFTADTTEKSIGTIDHLAQSTYPLFPSPHCKLRQ